MIRYENETLKDTVLSLSGNYFTFISVDGEFYNKINVNLADISSFYSIENKINKIHVNEFTNYKFTNKVKDDTVSIEKCTKSTKYRFIRVATFNKMPERLLDALNPAIIYIVIDNKYDIFKNLYRYLNKRDIPYLKIVHEKYYSLKDKKFVSVNRLMDYLYENYFP